MRLSEAKIKEAILHPEKLVRQKALLYFAAVSAETPRSCPRRSRP